MESVRIKPSGLYGMIKIPPSKSLCNRAIIAAGLSSGVSNIDNVIYSDDIITICNGMMDLGVDIKREENKLTIKGNDFLVSIRNEIDCNESGSALRFLIPLVLLTAEKVTFKGRGNLVSRPLAPYYEIFDRKKIYYSSRKGLPLTVQWMLSSGDYEVSGNISSQFITGLMFALPLLEGDSRILVTTELESKGYVDLTMDILSRCSVKVENNGYREFLIKGGQKYQPIDYRVEGDFSHAAFWLAAGILGGDVECLDLDRNSFQGDKVILDIIKKMGGNVLLNRNRISVNTSQTRGITIDASQCPDLVPVLSALASLSQGTTEIINAGRLRIKESDRLHSMAVELNKLGADIEEREDGLLIKGKEKLKGGVVDSWNDHRIAMALSVASIRCTEPVIITNSQSVKKSYPEFFKDFSMLGGLVEEYNLA